MFRSGNRIIYNQFKFKFQISNVQTTKIKLELDEVWQAGSHDQQYQMLQ